MENASKALLMAGGVLLAILIISLLVYTGNAISNYKSNSKDLADIDDLTEFNLQFTNYDGRKDVSGYEIISLCNRIADYNNRFSDAAGAKNDNGAEDIEMLINFESKDSSKADLDVQCQYDSDKGNYLFKYKKIYKQTTVKNEIANFITNGGEIESVYGSSSIASKVAKSINSFILTDDQQKRNQEKEISDVEWKRNALAEYNKITGNDLKTYDDMEAQILGDGDLSKSILAYYEYYQFKKAKFECTNIEYDSNSGKVNNIEFQFTGKIE